MRVGIHIHGTRSVQPCLRWFAVSHFLFMVFFAFGPASAQQPAAPDICSSERLSQSVSAYLMQRCFDENRMASLRRAIQRQQLQLEPADQKMADQLMVWLGINRAVLNALMLLLSEAEIDVESQAGYLAERLQFYRALTKDLDMLTSEFEREDIDALTDIAAKVGNGEWTLASTAAVGLEARALYSQKTNAGGDPLRSDRAALAENLLGQIALVEAKFVDAARHFSAAAEFAGPASEKGQLYGEAAADALYLEARKRWNERTIQESIDIYRQVLDARPRNQNAELWARTQDKLGTAILRLGAARRSAPLLTGAISAFEAALEVRTKSGDPAAWAQTMANLAGALVQLGNRLREQKDLRDAVVAYRQALTVVKFETEPGEWEELQANLGNALWSLGRLEEGSETLNEAVFVFTEALKGLDIERQARDWGATQNNIGAALFMLADRGSGVEHAAAAVAAFEASLNAYQEASAVYFITGVRKNLARARALLQDREAQQPPAPKAQSASPPNRTP